MTPKYKCSPILWWPKKYPQNLHAPKNIHFSESPKKTDIQNVEPKKMTRAYVCMKLSEYPPPPVGPGTHDLCLYTLTIPIWVCEFSSI